MPVPIEWYRKIKEDAIVAARKQNICRTYMPVKGPIGGIGVQQWSYDKTGEMSEALVSFQFLETAEDVVSFSRDHISIPVIQKEFRIDRRDLEAARNGTYPITTVNSDAAAYQITNIENEMVINGYSTDGTNYEIKGLMQSAGLEVDTAYDFATPGNALKAVSSGIDKLMKEEIYGPYNLSLNPTQYMELATSVYTGGVIELNMVEKLLGGNILVNNWITADQGMITTFPQKQFYELVIAQDMTVETEILTKSKALWGRLYECVVPVIYQPKSILRLNHI